MASASDHRLPTLEDARRAADALREALDPGEVLLFGSVAQGTQALGPDLDLVLVFDDLGDYGDRRLIAERARQTVLVATGFGCDVRVTDRPEWEVRSKRCRSTFEAHIASHAATLVSRPPRGGIDWEKEIGMAPSDADQAARSLNNAVNALTKLLLALEPSTKERDALLAGDLREAGTCPDDIDIAGDPDDATDEFSAQIARAAADMADCCIGLIEHQLGSPPSRAPPPTAPRGNCRENERAGGQVWTHRSDAARRRAGSRPRRCSLWVPCRSIWARPRRSSCSTRWGRAPSRC
ncbi:MAG: nucleotidyltransferase domain-containing protein [Acidimicrobiaceae bacterium]|nr:nucleotidyltransferase domain-containing protein [Acidimicrobiaceae bacterium]